jgi:hypothetical protein
MSRVIPTHGQVRPLAEMIDIVAFPYPNVSATSWRYDSGSCDVEEA